MKTFFVRLSLAAVLTLIAVAIASSTARAQQADEDPAPASPHQRQPTPAPQSPQQPNAAPSSDATQTQAALAFTGRVMSERGKLVLQDPVTKMTYQFDDPSKAKPYVGKEVKVTGRLEMNTNTIHIDRIAPLS